MIKLFVCTLLVTSVACQCPTAPGSLLPITNSCLNSPGWTCPTVFEEARCVEFCYATESGSLTLPQFYEIGHNLIATSPSNIENLLKGSNLSGVNGPSLTGSPYDVRTNQPQLIVKFIASYLVTTRKLCFKTKNVSKVKIGIRSDTGILWTHTFFITGSGWQTSCATVGNGLIPASLIPGARRFEFEFLNAGTGNMFIKALRVQNCL